MFWTIVSFPFFQIDPIIIEEREERVDAIAATHHWAIQNLAPHHKAKNEESIEPGEKNYLGHESFHS
jgi:hypothetical protein